MYNSRFYCDDGGDNIHSLHALTILVVELRVEILVSFAVVINKYK